jgi:glycosyltransferase involved in cell wall biosynthesis
MQAATAIASFARAGDEVVALGPGHEARWPLEGENVRWVPLGRPLVGRRVNLTPLRWRTGFVQAVNDAALGRAAAARLDEVRPDLLYVFTQVAREPLRWARRRGVPSILDNPNGHIRGFRDVCIREWKAWCAGPWTGHPTPRAARHIEDEYVLADRVRVSSAWAKESMVTRGVPAEKVLVVDQPLDLARFTPGDRASGARDEKSAVRLCFAGSVDVRKGVFHLLRAMRAARAPSELVVVGSTGNRPTRIALERESKGLAVTLAPGDPVPAYRASDLFVLPTLEDGFGFVVAEAMACGLPVLATDACGAAEWVAEAGAGWIVPAGDAAALARAIDEAAAARSTLAAMGARGRAYVTKRASARCFDALRTAALGAPGSARPREAAQ